MWRKAGCRLIANAPLPVHRVHRIVYNEYEKYEQNRNPKLEERLLWGGDCRSERRYAFDRIQIGDDLEESVRSYFESLRKR